MKQILTSKYLVWFVLMLPGILFLVGWERGTVTYDSLMHATGEFSARFLIFSLIATPLMLLLPEYRFPQWLAHHRRYFGLAAFAYGLVHTMAYLLEVPSSQVWKEFFELGMLTGWIGFIIWIPLAMTSNNYSVRKLSKNWKKLQRFTYPAALLVVLHWMLIHYNWKPALVHFVPVLLLQIYRVWKQRDTEYAENLIYR